MWVLGVNPGPLQEQLSAFNCLAPSPAPQLPCLPSVSELLLPETVIPNSVDRCGQVWTCMDECELVWTGVVGCGRVWMGVDGLCESCLLKILMDISRH